MFDISKKVFTSDDQSLSQPNDPQAGTSYSDNNHMANKTDSLNQPQEDNATGNDTLDEGASPDEIGEQSVSGDILIQHLMMILSKTRMRWVFDLMKIASIQNHLILPRTLIKLKNTTEPINTNL